MPAEPAPRGSSRVVVPDMGLNCEHTRMPVNSKGVRATHARPASARDLSDRARSRRRGDGRRRRARTRRDRRPRRGRPGRLLGRDARGRSSRALEADGAGAARRRPVRRRGDLARGWRAWDGPQGAKMALDGVVARLARQVASGQPALAPARRRPRRRRRPRTRSGSTRVEGTADRTRRATGYEVLKIKVGGPGDLERLRAVRAADGRAAADRRQRGLGPRRPPAR